MPWAALGVIIATVSVFAISQGLSYPLLSFIPQRDGVSPALIGASAAMTPLGFIISSPFIPCASRRFSPGLLAIGCAAMAALMLALIGLAQDVWLWFPLRFLLGFFANPFDVETGFDSGEPLCRRKIDSTTSTAVDMNSDCQFWNDSNHNRASNK